MKLYRAPKSPMFEKGEYAIPNIWYPVSLELAKQTPSFKDTVKSGYTVAG